MSEFVNYNKRDINLPPGCKDLIDVLRPAKLPAGSKAWRGMTMRGRETTTIAGIPKHIRNFLRMNGQAVLLISAPDEHVTLDLRRLFPGEIFASVTFVDDTSREARVREFFARYVIDAPAPTLAPQQFLPNAPVWIKFPIRPFPPHATRLVEIATAVFRDLGRVTEEIPLQFRRYTGWLPKR